MQSVSRRRAGNLTPGTPFMCLIPPSTSTHSWGLPGGGSYIHFSWEIIIKKGQRLKKNG